MDIRLYQLVDHRIKGNPAIRLYCYFRGKYYTLPTGIRLPSKYWDKAKQKVKPTYPLHFEYNRFLSNFVNLVTKKTLDFLATNPKPTHHQFKEFWKQIKNTNNGNAFFEVFDAYIKDKTIAPGTKVKYKTIWKQLKAFDPNLTFDDIDLEFADAFTNYLIDKGLTDNTIHKTFEFLKTFMRWAKERGYHQNEEFHKIRHKATVPDLIALTSEEFERIRTLELPPSLARYRDFFVFQCLTGQRFSDYSKFSLDDVKGNIWYLRQKKTREPLQIPLVEPALDILRRYNGLPKITNQVLNRMLKVIGRLAGIDTPHTITRYRGGLPIERSKPKYEFITTHVARRTFITLSLEKGMRPEVVMEISGHKDWRVFKQYIKIVTKVKEKEMEKWNA